MEKEHSKSLTRRVGLILGSIGISNIGDWIYFIALNLMILSSYKSAWSVGGLYVIRPFADLLTNMICGSFVDRLNKRKWLYSLDFIRSGLIMSLLFNQSLIYIYPVVF